MSAEITPLPRQKSRNGARNNLENMVHRIGAQGLALRSGPKRDRADLGPLKDCAVMMDQIVDRFEDVENLVIEALPDGELFVYVQEHIVEEYAPAVWPSDGLPRPWLQTVQLQTGGEPRYLTWIKDRALITNVLHQIVVQKIKNRRSNQADRDRRGLPRIESKAVRKAKRLSRGSLPSTSKRRRIGASPSSQNDSSINFNSLLDMARSRNDDSSDTSSLTSCDDMSDDQSFIEESLVDNHTHTAPTTQHTSPTGSSHPPVRISVPGLQLTSQHAASDQFTSSKEITHAPLVYQGVLQQAAASVVGNEDTSIVQATPMMAPVAQMGTTNTVPENAASPISRRGTSNLDDLSRVDSAYQTRAKSAIAIPEKEFHGDEASSPVKGITNEVDRSQSETNNAAAIDIIEFRTSGFTSVNASKEAENADNSDADQETNHNTNHEVDSSNNLTTTTSAITTNHPTTDPSNPETENLPARYSNGPTHWSTAFLNATYLRFGLDRYEIAASLSGCHDVSDLYTRIRSEIATHLNRDQALVQLSTVDIWLRNGTLNDRIYMLKQTGAGRLNWQDALDAFYTVWRREGGPDPFVFHGDVSVKLIDSEEEL